MAKRKFLRNDVQKQTLLLFTCLQHAMQEPEESRKKWKTDIYGVAAQYGKAHGIIKEDYENFKSWPIEVIVNTILK